MVDDPLIDELLEAITAPLDERDVWTFDMTPWREPIGVGFGPRTISFFLRLVRPAKDLKTALSLGLAIESYVGAVLRTPPGERCPVRVSNAGAFLVVEVPRPDPERLTLSGLQMRSANTLLLGLDSRSLPIHVDFDALQTGALVVGTSGSGKSNAMLLLSLQALAAGWELAIVDLKGGRDWAILRDYARWGWATLPQDAAGVLSFLLEEIDRRNRPGASTSPGILLVFDELPRASKELQGQLAELTALGRSAGLRTLAGTQRAGREIEPMIKQNLRSRLVGLCRNAQESTDACGQPDAGAETLLGRGDMLWIVDGGPPERVQVALVEPGDFEQVLSGIPRATPVRVPEETQEEARPRTFDDVMSYLGDLTAENPQRKPIPPAVVRRCLIEAGRTGRVPTHARIREIWQAVEGRQGATWAWNAIQGVTRELCDFDKAQQGATSLTSLVGGSQNGRPGA